MLPSEIKLMLDGVVSDLKPAYESRKSKALRELKFKMMRQGLGKSSAFDQGIAQIFFDSFDDYVRLVLGEVKRVLKLGANERSASRIDASA